MPASELLVKSGTFGVSIAGPAVERHRTKESSSLEEPCPTRVPCLGWDALGLRVREFSMELEAQRATPCCMFPAGTVRAAGSAMRDARWMSQRRAAPEHPEHMDQITSPASRSGPSRGLRHADKEKGFLYCLCRADLWSVYFSISSERASSNSPARASSAPERSRPNICQDNAEVTNKHGLFLQV